MRALSDSDFLNLWERGAGLHPLDQGLLALGAAIPEVPYDRLADWPLGRRNQALADLRRACFGPRLQAWVACVRCGEKLEFEMDVRALTSDAHNEDHSVSEPIVVRGVPFRLPTTADLARAARETDVQTATARLLESCRLEGWDPPAWTPADLEEVGQRMASADPMAETRLSLLCPCCGNECDEALDIATFVWAEIESRAKRLLLEVHALASAYGWTEQEVLSLSEHRRAMYLEMVQQ